MTQAESLYHQIAEQFSDEAQKGKMFGALCLKAPNNKALAMFYKDEMVFKLTEEGQHKALGLEGAKVFAPMGDRQMKGWIQVPSVHQDLWPELTREALAYVSSLPPNLKKSKK